MNARARWSVIGGGRTGAVSAIGAVSPPGGDISEPVSQATLRIVKVFWGLSANLAYRRHFPAIDWLTSYSLYADSLAVWFDENISEDWSELRNRALVLLQEEAELEEIVRLVGMDALSIGDRLKIESARSLREDFLQQNAFNEVDTYASGKKQRKMLSIVFMYYDLAKDALDEGADFSVIESLPVREEIGRMKYIPEDEFEARTAQIQENLKTQIADAVGGGA